MRLRLTFRLIASVIQVCMSARMVPSVKMETLPRHVTLMVCKTSFARKVVLSMDHVATTILWAMSKSTKGREYAIRKYLVFLTHVLDLS